MRASRRCSIPSRFKCRYTDIGALWDYVSRVCGGGGGCASGGVPLRAVLALSWWRKVSLGGEPIIIVFRSYNLYLSYAASGDTGQPVGFLGDQTVYTWINYQDPSLVYPLGCEWNRQLSQHVYLQHPIHRCDNIVCMYMYVCICVCIYAYEF